MPRTKVPPGSSSKRSASSASSWRCPNFSCCATCVTASPCSSRARLSSGPAPALGPAPLWTSVKVPPLQCLELRGARETPAQLVGERLLGDALAEPALDAQREPQRFRGRLHHLVVARHELPRRDHVALVVADLAQLQQRARLVG